MVPLETVQGLSPSELKKIIGGRDIYIWGSGPVGRGVLIGLQKTGFSPVGFIDGRASEEGLFFRSLPVLNAENIISDKLAFIIIANMQVRKIAETLCSKHGRKKMVDYLTHYQISRPEAAIDVAGICNIKCPSCPRGNMFPVLPEGCMSLMMYKRVLQKLLLDIPHLTHVELYTWGEPLLNPEIDKIVKYTEQFLPSTIATNLLITDQIEPLLRANPSQLNVTINGFEAQYEINMKGASWALLMKNLICLKDLYSALKCSTVVTLLSYECSGEDREKLKEIAMGFGFPIVFCTSYVNPYEHYSDYLQQNKKLLINGDLKIKSLCSVDTMLGLANDDKNNPCLNQRIFPIINWDASVALCHTYYGPVIADNYLEISWDDLLAERHHRVECISCQEKGLHRFDVDVLEQRYL